MKRKHKILITLLAVAVTVSLTTVPAFALTESEVQDQVNAVGKEVVTGNLFVWFLCAIAFLKVSQKIDSFMSSLGINVGHTGGSMLAEAMIAMRGIGTARTFAGRGGSGGSSSGSGGGNTFMKGGLSGVVSRKVTNTAINNAVTKQIFRRDKRNSDEQKVMLLANQAMLSTAEMIKCAELNTFAFDSEDELIDTLYHDEYTTSENIAHSVRFLPQCRPVITSVANLYLRKQIIFERM